MIRPLARTENLSIRHMDGESVIYDLKTNKVHCLNGLALLVWNHCDGQTSLETLARLVQIETGAKDADALVQLALEQLSKRNLLQTPLPMASKQERLQRRDVLKKLVIAAVSVPVIMTIRAPKAHAQMSSADTGTETETDEPADQCTQDADCPGFGSENECAPIVTCVDGQCVSTSRDGQPCDRTEGLCMGGECL